MEAGHRPFLLIGGVVMSQAGRMDTAPCLPLGEGRLVTSWVLRPLRTLNTCRCRREERSEEGLEFFPPSNQHDLLSRGWWWGFGGLCAFCGPKKRERRKEKRNGEKLGKGGGLPGGVRNVMMMEG